MMNEAKKPRRSHFTKKIAKLAIIDLEQVSAN